MEKFFKPTEIKKESLILTNCLITDPANNYQEKGDIIIIDGKITDFGPNTAKNYQDKNLKNIDCQENIVCPGLIDMQVHFRDPGQSQKEDMVTGSMSAARGGITSVVCQPNTNPVIDNLHTTEYLKYKAKEEAYCNVYAYAAISKNMQGEELSPMHDLSEQENIVGFTDDGLPVMNAHLMRRALEYAKTLNMVVAQHAEDLNISNKGCINEGKVSEELGVRGIANASEAVIVARDIELVKITGGKYHVLHVSAKESLDYIRQAKAQNLSVTCEVSPHHFSLTEDAVLECSTNAKMNPPLRSKEDRQALIEGIIDGTVDAIATDHAPHELAGKEKSLAQASFGIIGTETMLALALELYQQKKISLMDLLAKMTINPAKILNIARGKIAKGEVADLTIIDLDKKWQFTKDQIVSKSKNSPFIDRKFTGKAVMTILAGKVVYQD